jgi:hypothetical protein
MMAKNCRVCRERIDVFHRAPLGGTGKQSKPSGIEYTRLEDDWSNVQGATKIIK